MKITIRQDDGQSHWAVESGGTCSEHDTPEAALGQARALMGCAEPLKRMRLELLVHDSDLVLVGDRFDEGGRYIQVEMHRSQTHNWTAEQWADLYDRLERNWRRKAGEPDVA